MVQLTKKAEDTRQPLTPTQIDGIRAFEGMLPESVVAKQFKISEEDVRRIWDSTYINDMVPAGPAKLSPVDAQLVIGAQGLLSAKELAAKFAVGESTIYNIWSGDSWRDLKRPQELAYRGKIWLVRLAVLMMQPGEYYTPQELADELGLSSSTVRRGFDMLKRAGLDIAVAPGGQNLKERRFYVRNGDITGELLEYKPTAFEHDELE